MINNFDIIEKFMKFEEGHFYKFECLVRNTDGENPLYQGVYSNANKNILIKSWWVDSREYYNKIKNGMVQLCNLTGGRLYMTLDRKACLKVLRESSIAINDILINYCVGSSVPSPKKLAKLFASKSSVFETSDHDCRTIMFDVDTKDEYIKEAICTYIQGKGQYPYILETKKGYHIFCYRKFGTSSWERECYKWYCHYASEGEKQYKTITEFCEVVSVKPNELGLVYLR